MMGHEDRIAELLEQILRQYSEVGLIDSRIRVKNLARLAATQLEYIQVLESRANISGKDIPALSVARHGVLEAMQAL